MLLQNMVACIGKAFHNISGNSFEAPAGMIKMEMGENHICDLLCFADLYPIQTLLQGHGNFQAIFQAQFHRQKISRARDQTELSAHLSSTSKAFIAKLHIPFLINFIFKRNLIFQAKGLIMSRRLHL